jgi:hypothetical protein
LIAASAKYQHQVNLLNTIITKNGANAKTAVIFSQILLFCSIQPLEDV